MRVPIQNAAPPDQTAPLRGRIADVRRCSVDDGPGIRTAVFFKGCPLHCAWCHNPECIRPEREELFYPEKCIGCGKCAFGCYTGARQTCGEDMTVEDVMSIIREDAVYYGQTGGVTFSGGERMMQQAFLSALIDACRKEGYRTAVETSLIRYDEEIFRKLDLVMADIKIWDSALHETYTGVPNRQILAHFGAFDTLGVPIWVRTPVIPDIPQDIPRIAAFVKTLTNAKKYELLPYHPLGVSKAAALGREQKRFRIPTAEEMENLRKYADI